MTALGFKAVSVLVTPKVNHGPLFAEEMSYFCSADLGLPYFFYPVSYFWYQHRERKMEAKICLNNVSKTYKVVPTEEETE